METLPTVAIKITILCLFVKKKYGILEAQITVDLRNNAINLNLSLKKTSKSLHAANV